MVSAVSAQPPPFEATTRSRAVARGAESGSAPAQSAAQPEQQTDVQGLTAEEQRVVAELQRTDRQVRAHEAAHLAAAGGLARGVSFSYTSGPDGKQYAVGGEVSIDSSPVAGDPDATIRKAQQVRAAANAPANPSGQDRAVAAQAAQLETAARAELAQRRRAADDDRGAAQTAQFSANQGDFQRILDEIA